MGDFGTIGAKISTVAARQYGHVTRAQLLAVGLESRTISKRIESGRLIVVHAGVYAVDYRRREPVAQAAAAVLACGRGAVMSHSSAAVLWGMSKRWQVPFEVTVPGDRRRPGIRTHRSQTLSRRDVRRQCGIPVTSPARTLLDFAPQLSDRALVRAFNDGRLSGHVRRDDLVELLDRRRNHRGAGRLRQLTERPTSPTRSEFEDAFVALARRFGLPTPRINARVAGYEVDVLFERERVIVELDGYRFHGVRSSFERDRERDAATLAAGYATLRLTWRRLTGAPEREAQRLCTILESRRAP